MSTQIIHSTNFDTPIPYSFDYYYFVCDTCGDKVASDHWHIEAGAYPHGWSLTYHPGNLQKAHCPKHTTGA